MRKIVFAVAFLASAANAGSIQNILDINRTVQAGPTLGETTPFPAIGSRWLVSLCNPSCTPWMTDGTPGNARQLGTMRFDGAAAASDGTLAYFVSSDGPYVVWRTDGTPAGTVQVWSGTGSVASLRRLGNATYFSSGTTLWRIDDGAPSATQVYTFTDAVDSIGTLPGRLFLAIGYPATLWVSDGTPAGTSQIGNVSGVYGYPASPVQIGGRVFFWYATTNFDFTLWSSDGTAAGTYQVSPLVNSGLSRVVNLGGTAVATLARPDGSMSLVASDGSPGGAIEIGHWTIHGLANDLAVSGSQAYFAADDGSTGVELWQTDGTAAGTHLAADINPGVFAANPQSLVASTDGLYFHANDATDSAAFFLPAGSSTPVKLGSSNGLDLPWAPMGPRMLFRGINLAARISTSGSPVAPLLTAPGEPNLSSRCQFSNGYPAQRVGATMYFLADDGLHGCALWKSDGTAAGTSIVLDSAGQPLPSSNSPSFSRAVVGNVLYFAGMNSRLYRTDGTPQGTYVQLNGVGDLVAVGPYLFIRDTSSKLIRFDTRTTVITNVDPANFYSMSLPSLVNGRIVWWGYNGAASLMSAPVDAGQGQIISAVGPGLDVRLLPSGRQAYFIGNSPSSGGEPWITDGTAGGTHIAADLNAGTGSSVYQVLGTGRGLGWFGDSSYTLQVFRSDGSNLGSFPLASVVARSPGAFFNGRFYFYGSCPGQSFYGLCATDGGTTANAVGGPGTVQAGSVFSLGNTVVADATFNTSAQLVFTAGSAQRTATVDVPSFVLDFPLSMARLSKGLFLMAQAGSGQEPSLLPYSAIPRITRIPAGMDLDGDGAADLLWQHPSGQGGAWLMDGAQLRGTAALAPPAPGSVPFMSADFDGDGHNDILWRTPQGRYDVTLMNGLAPIPGATAKLIDAGSGWEVVGKGDFDGDRRADLFWRHSSGLHGVWLMNGVAPYSTAAVSPPAGGSNASLFADLDGDGRTDVVWVSASGQVDVTLMSGVSGTNGHLLDAGSGWKPTLAGDLDGDGKADLVWKHADGSHGAWLMDGTFVRGNASILGPGSGWTARFLADLDGDGQMDLVWSHTDGSWGGWLMDGLQPRAYGLLLGANYGWSIAGIADLDGDTRADLIWRDTGGQYGVWLMEGLSARSTAGILPGGSGWEVVP